MKKLSILLVGLALPVGCLAQHDPQPTRAAFQPGISVGIRAGTAGIGLDVAKSITPRWVLRLGGNLFSYSGTLKSGKDTDDIQLGFDYKLNLASVNAFIDFYPFPRAGFRLTGGVFYNLNELTFNGTPTKEVSFNDVTFSRQEIGTINGQANFNKIAPYLGLGWGHPFRGTKLTFMVDVGAFYQQSPQVTLVTTGMLEPSSDQGPVIEHNLRPLKYYPVLNLGLSYRL